MKKKVINKKKEARTRVLHIKEYKDNLKFFIDDVEVCADKLRGCNFDKIIVDQELNYLDFLQSLPKIEDEKENETCHKCGHVYKKDTGKSIETAYEVLFAWKKMINNYCFNCIPKYDRRVLDDSLWVPTKYYKEVECDENGEIVKKSNKHWWN